MILRNVRKIVVTDADGKELTFEGIEGHVMKQTKSKKGAPYQQTISAYLVLPDEGVINK